MAEKKTTKRKNVAATKRAPRTPKPKAPESEKPQEGTTLATLLGESDIPGGVSDDVALASLDGIDGREAITAVPKAPKKKARKRTTKKQTAKRTNPAKKKAAGTRRKGKGNAED